MSMSGKERRILAEIEQALERDDPELARRVAAINDIESDGVPTRRGDDLLPHAQETTPPSGQIGPASREPRGRRSWIIIVVVALTLLLLVLAVATA